MNALGYSQTNRKSTPPLKIKGAFRANGIQERRNRSNAGQGWLLFQRADEAAASGVYYPETLKSMCVAFNLAWKNMSPMFEDQEKARQILAVQIFHHVDRGEHNVGRLATSATDDLIALTGASDRSRSQTRSASAKASTNRNFVAYRALRYAT